MKSRLSSVQKGRLRAPLRFCFYGPEGVGKSSLAAHAPDPIWIDVEDGSGQLDVARYPFREGPGGHVPYAYQEILGAIDDLTASAHNYRTLVIDTADRLEAMIWRFMVERDAPSSKVRLTNIESYGYGKGYNSAVDEWRALCLRLDRLRMAKGMSVIFLAHAQIRQFKNPEGDDYDRYNLRINEKAAGFLKEWCDITGFACFEEGASALEKGDRPKGYSTGRRLLRFGRTAAFDAKTRYALPTEVDLDPIDPWAPLAKVVSDALELGPEELAKQIGEETKRIGDEELTTKVDKAVGEALKKADAATLSRYLMDLKRRQPKPQQESAAA